MAITNDQLIVRANHARLPENQDFVDDLDVQPRLLAPITAEDDITAGNGFDANTLNPGDMILVLDDAFSNNKPALLIRDTTNALWYRVPCGTTATAQVYTLTNETEDRVFDADAATITETNDVLATVINDLKAVGIFK
jgi:hypothetical protein